MESELILKLRKMRGLAREQNEILHAIIGLTQATIEDVKQMNETLDKMMKGE